MLGCACSTVYFYSFFWRVSPHLVDLGKAFQHMSLWVAPDCRPPGNAIPGLFLQPAITLLKALLLIRGVVTHLNNVVECLRVELRNFGEHRMHLRCVLGAHWSGKLVTAGKYAQELRNSCPRTSVILHW